MPNMLRFVVYSVESTMEYKSFNFEHHAKACVKKLNEKEQERSNPRHRITYAYSTSDHYKNNVVKMVKRKNLMSGQEYEEPSNTPLCCSPASETYWSM